MDDSLERIEVVGRRLSIVPPVDLYLDGLPLITA